MSRRMALIGMLLLTLAGCLSPQARLQMADDAEAKKDLSIKTIGDIADIHTVGPVQVSAIALVTGLDGTGDMAARRSPRKRYSCCNSGEFTIRMTASAIESMSCGSIPIAASPTTSGSAPPVVATSGVPHAIPSMAGSENPSYSDGTTATSASA